MSGQQRIEVKASDLRNVYSCLNCKKEKTASPLIVLIDGPVAERVICIEHPDPLDANSGWCHQFILDMTKLTERPTRIKASLCRECWEKRAPMMEGLKAFAIIGNVPKRVAGDFERARIECKDCGTSAPRKGFRMKLDSGTLGLIASVVILELNKPGFGWSHVARMSATDGSIDYTWEHHCREHTERRAPAVKEGPVDRNKN